MRDLIRPYLQDQPDLTEDVPETMERMHTVAGTKQAIMDMLPDTDGPVLEIGPAAGWCALQLQKRYGHVTCLTLFEAEAEAIRAHGLDDVTVADMHEMPADWSDRYAVIHASHVLEHSPAPYIALSEMFRILHIGGVAQIVMPAPNGYTHLGAPRPKRLGSFPRHLFCASIETVIEMAWHVGFEFDAFHLVPQADQSSGDRALELVHYWNRVWMLSKPAEPPIVSLTCAVKGKETKT